MSLVRRNGFSVMWQLTWLHMSELVSLPMKVPFQGTWRKIHIPKAEHDEQATAICITTSQKRLQRSYREKLGASFIGTTIIEQSIADYGRFIVVNTLEEAFELVNELAPEHLQLMIENPMEKMQYIQNAGAIFLGNHSPEALGDYIAGPNHTLPTSGTSTFSYPLRCVRFFKEIKYYLLF